jgi:hypothetical protein
MATDASAATSTSTVAVSLLEYSLASGGCSSPLAATGFGVSVPSSGAGAVTLLGGGSDLGQAAPFSGLPSLSNDGQYIVFPGYATPAGSLVGAASNLYTANNPASESNANAALPPASMTRVIAFVDKAGNVGVVQSAGLSAAIGTMPVHSAHYVAAGAASGFYFTCGLDNGVVVNQGGTFFLPMPSGIAGTPGAPALLIPSNAGSTAGTTANLKMSTWISQFQGTLYSSRMASGSSAGVGGIMMFSNANVSSAPTSGTGGFGYSAHQFAFVTAGDGSVSLYVADGLSGLLYYPGCVITPLSCEFPRTRTRTPCARARARHAHDAR